MKSRDLLFILTSIICLSIRLCNSKSRTSKMRKFNIKDIHTPKGFELSNHFGANPYSNSYGPKPELVVHEALFQNGDGSVSKKYIKQIIHGETSQNEKGCDITQQDWYAACLNIKDCAICTASVHCGWCELRRACYPAKMKEAACPGECQNGWNFEQQSCSANQVVSGHFGHWSKNMDHVSTVEYTYPKYRLDTVYTAPQVIRTPVLLGSLEESNQLDKSDAKDSTLQYRRHFSSIKPIYGEIHQVIPVDVHSVQYIDRLTGKRLDHWGDQNINYHGVDDLFINSDTPIYKTKYQSRRESTQQKLSSESKSL